MAVLLAMTTDLAEGSPAGRLYGGSLATALAVYLLNRYTARRYAPVAYQGGLPGYRLKRVLDHIGDNLADDLSLSQLAAVAGMSPHYLLSCSGRAPVALPTGMCYCSESSAPNKVSVTPGAASSKRD
jgi:AraC family transcriptional regulator